jgi:hypothetical protein
VNPLDFMSVAVGLLADRCVAFFAGFFSVIAKLLLVPVESQSLDLRCDRPTAQPLP